jgi:uncharacterized membrane protein
MANYLSSHRRSFWTAGLSFTALAGLMLATNPTDKIIFAFLFFVLALIFLVSFGYLIVRIQTGEVSSKNRYRIVALSLVILTLLMFRSAQSLNWVDAVILVLIGFGLAFYISRRA